MRCFSSSLDAQTLMKDRKANNYYSERWVTSKKTSIYLDFGFQPEHLGKPGLPSEKNLLLGISENIFIYLPHSQLNTAKGCCPKFQGGKLV